MIKFHYRKEVSIISDTVLRPIAEVTLEYNNQRIKIAMYIDSGADITIILLERGKTLGFKQNPEDEILEIKVFLVVAFHIS